MRPAARLLTIAGVSALTLFAYASTSSAATPSTAYETIRVDAPEPQHEGRWGERSRTLRDLTGDGVNEILVSTPKHDVAGVRDAGRAWILNGATRSLVRVIESPEIQLNANFGFWIEVLGDVTGDGREDFAVGTDAQDVGANADQGKAWVFNGATGAVLYALDNPAPQPSARFGSRIGRAGDLTGDGRSEVIVGAISNDMPPACAFGIGPSFPAGCRENEGQAFIFNGATGGLYRTLNMPDPVLPTCDESFGTVTVGCGRFGYSPQTPGDTDGDGVADQLVNAGTWNQARGRLYLFSGSNTQAADAPSVPRLRIDDPEPERGPQPGVWFGFQDAEPFAPGDVNGDGHADVFGGAYEEAVPAGQAEGRAYVFDGRSGAVLYALNDPSPSPTGQFGWSLAKTDYNQDGVPDLYVGAAPHMSGSADQGTYVFDGRNGAPLKTFELPSSDAQPFIEAPTRDIGPALGWTVSAPGDLNGDGEPDYVAGAPFLNVANKDQGGLYLFLSQSQAAPGPAPAPGPPPGRAPGPAPDVAGKFTAKMSLARATINRRDRVLDVLAPITARASGRVRVQLHAAGRRFNFTAPIDSADGRIRFRQPIPVAQARLGTGIVTIRYLGDADTRPQTVRLRAAFRPAVLRLQRPQIVNDRVRASGTVSKLARGVVRLQLEYDRGGNTSVLRFRAQISNGRWSLNERLSETQLRRIAQREGTVHSYTLFTGYFQARMRGEMRSFQVLGAR